jgi:hypothetical protein
MTSNDNSNTNDLGLPMAEHDGVAMYEAFVNVAAMFADFIKPRGEPPIDWFGHYSPAFRNCIKWAFYMGAAQTRNLIAVRRITDETTERPFAVFDELTDEITAEFKRLEDEASQLYHHGDTIN